MKDIRFTIELTTHMLANSAGSDGQRDCFQRDSGKRLLFQQSWWYSAFRKAIEMEPVKHIKPGDIFMDLTVEAKTEMYKRRYGQGQTRTHEAIMPGTQVTFIAMVSDHVTESALRRILERMGRFVGLSPYGHKLGYGHFNLIELHVAPSEAAGRIENEAQSNPSSDTTQGGPTA